MNFFYKWNRKIVKRYADVSLSVYVSSSLAAFLGNYQTYRDHEIHCLYWHTPIGPTLIGFTWLFLVYSVMSANIQTKGKWPTNILYLFSWLFLDHNIFWYGFDQFFGIRIYLDICLFIFLAPEYILIFFLIHFMCYFTIGWPLLTY